MKPDDLTLSSVNWEYGMLLTPENFVRQEKYIDSALLWILRYATDGFGLVGGGARLPASERGAVRHDPIVVVDEDDEALNIAVTQCRGLTPAGSIVEIDPEHPVRCRIAHGDLEGVAESGVYVTCEPHDKEAVDGTVDDFNPQMKTERRQRYRLSLQVRAEDAGYSLAVARIRRPRAGAGYEKDSQFIPPCTSMLSCSELASAWREIVEEVTSLSGRYTELYRAMQEFLVLMKERGIETDLDRETADFAGRMVVAMEAVSYEILDPVQPPQRFFAHLRRFFHSTAVYLDLSPPAQQYFQTLKETGETEFIALIGQQKQELRASRTFEIHEDLAVEVRAALQSLSALRQLEQALEGKYVDFRVSTSLEGMQFVFDRGGKVLYKLAAKPARVQGFADEMTMVFSQLRLEGRDKYRLILIGEQNATFETGTKIVVEIRLNEGSGFRRQPVILSNESKAPGQRNFEFDFDAPDVPTITDIRVGLEAHHPIRTGLLFVRQRFYSSRTDEPARPVQPAGGEEPPPRGRLGYPEAAPAAPPPQPPQADPYAARRRFSEPAPDDRRPERPEPAPGAVKPPPWETLRRTEPPERQPSDPPPPRRRRLE
ncbi:MAG: type VI secretion system baseplate subunit TssK [Terriglobia bacterium]